MKFDIKQERRQKNRDKSLIKLLKSPAIMASGISDKIILSTDPNELCVRLKLLLQEKQAGNNSDIIIQENVIIIDEPLEYKHVYKNSINNFY